MAQENLVRNGNFEEGTVPGVITDCDPLIPYHRGFIRNQNSWTNYQEPTIDENVPYWRSFGHPYVGQGKYHCEIFDTRAVCDYVITCDNNNDVDCQEYNGEGNVGVPNNFYGTQPHRTPIDYLSGGTTIGRYAGIKTRALSIYNPGIYTKLKQPLKCGYTYHLKFWAVSKSTIDSQDKLQIRLCKSLNWHDESILDGNNQNELIANVDVGDTWQQFDFTFTVEDNNVQYLFIRSATIGTRILIDDIEIPNQCEVDYACDRTKDNASIDVHVGQNYLHGPTHPLTFYNSEFQKDFHLEIYTILGQIIRTIEIEYPGPEIAWDGRDDNGTEVANGTYVFKLRYGSACACKYIEHQFVKIGDTPICFDEIYWEVDNVTGALTFHNLENVSTMEIQIYSADGSSLVTYFTVNSPYHTISWNGTYDPNVAGSPTVIPFPNGEWCDHPTNFKFTAVFKSECCYDRYELKPFTQECFNDPTFIGPQFSFKPVEKTVTCEHFFNYESYNITPTPCCDQEIDLFLSDVTLYGQQEFYLKRDIQAGPKVIVASNSDILFQAGREIRLVNDFFTEPGAEFLARIVPCTRMVMEEGPSNIINWNTIPDFTFENNTKSQIDSAAVLNVFPNPTSGELYVQSEVKIKAITIYDLTGKSISSESYLNKGTIVRIDAETLLNGIYILQIELDNGAVEIRKVIKN